MSEETLSPSVISIAVVVPVFNRKDSVLDYLRRFEAIEKVGFSCELIIVDDGSKDGTAEAVKAEFPGVTVLEGDGNLWWTGGVNMGMAHALGGDYTHILLMNDDVGFKPDFLTKLVQSAMDFPLAIIASVTLRADSDRAVILKAGMKKSSSLFERVKSVLPGKELDQSVSRILRVDAVSGRSVLIPVQIVRIIGLHDQKRFPHGGADIEYGFRARRWGFEVLVDTHSVVFTTLGRDKNLYSVLRTAGRFDFFKTLFSLKYSWHARSMFHMCMLDRNPMIGLAVFLVCLGNILKWVMLKMVLSQRSFEAFLEWRTGKKAVA